MSCFESRVCPPVLVCNDGADYFAVAPNGERDICPEWLSELEDQLPAVDPDSAVDCCLAGYPQYSGKLSWS